MSAQRCWRLRGAQRWLLRRVVHQSWSEPRGAELGKLFAVACLTLIVQNAPVLGAEVPCERRSCGTNLPHGRCRLENRLLALRQ
jgi:hypothetical protein